MIRRELKITLWLLCCLLSAGMLHAAEYVFSPEQMSGLKRLLGSGGLQPGDRVVLQDGVYSGWDEFDFQANGSSDAPVVFTALHPGKAILSGAMNMHIYGSHLVVDGLVFHKAWAVGRDMISFRKEGGNCAVHSRLTNCVIDDCNDPEKDKAKSEYWVGLYGKNNRVDHCYFANKTVAGLVVQIWLDEDGYENNHRVDHNFFGYRPPFGGNGAEIIRVGHSWSSQHSSRTIVEDNVFYHCDGENETISVKSCDNIVRRNLFYENRGGLVCRHGHNNLLESNVFIGNNLPGTMGIRVINQGHRIYNNYLQDITGGGSDAALVVRMGVYEKPTPGTDITKEPLTSYHRVVDVDIAFNTFVNCRLINLGQGAGDKEPRNVRFANNLVYHPDVRTNITISNPSVLSGIRFFNNYMAFGKGSDFSMDGFIRSSMVFRKQDAGAGKGLYCLETDDPLTAAGGFDYIRADATGNPRTGDINAGAVQLVNRGKKFDAVSPALCGVDWYEPLQNEIRAILQKTTF